jgi:catechol 2,3-dioxygenase-like lactoylglutathione lyase family enzyme
MAGGWSTLNQMAFVVPDIGAGIDFWTRTMGVGPFFVFPELHAQAGDYRGEDFIYQFGAAIAFSGDLNIELIEPRGRSIFDDFLKAGGTGMHHTCRFVEDMASSEAELVARGAMRLQGATFGPGSQVAYFDMTGDETIILELAQLPSESLALFEEVRKASQQWDGQTRTLDLGL